MAGAIPTQCHLCPSNENIRKNNGCGEFKKAPRPVFRDRKNGTTINYFNCPTKFIPEVVHQFSNIYQYNKKFNCSKPWEDLPNRYLEAVRIYESKVNEIENEKNKRAIAKSKVTNGK